MAKTVTFFTPEIVISTSADTDGQFFTPDGAGTLLVAGFMGTSTAGSPLLKVASKIGTQIAELTTGFALVAGAFSFSFSPTKDGGAFGESVGLRVTPGGASALAELFAQGHFL